MGEHKSNPVAQQAKLGGPLRLVFPGADAKDTHDIESVEVVFVGSDKRGRLVELNQVEQMAIARTIITARKAQARLDIKPELRFADVVVMPRDLANGIVGLANTGRTGQPFEDEIINEAWEFLGIKEEVKSCLG